MSLSPRLRLASLAALAAAAVAVLALACSDDTTGATVGSDGGATSGKDGSSASEADASEQASDAGSDTGSGAIEDGPGAAGVECAFNRDCQAALRCECTEANGCACAPGARGTGRNGLDECDSGDQCASSLCVEGPDPGVSICSDACKDESDCTGKLPRCIPIAGIPEPICARQP